MDTRQQQPTFSCGLCDEADFDEMVQCDECDTWYHFECVDLASITEEESWICPRCMGQQNTVAYNNSESQASNLYQESVHTHNDENENTLQDEASNQDLAIGSVLRQPVNQGLAIGSVLRQPVNHSIATYNQMLNPLHHNAVIRPTLNQSTFNNNIMTGYYMSPGVTQGVYMAQRQIFEFRTRPQFNCSTPILQLNRQRLIPQQPMNQRRLLVTGLSHQSQQVLQSDPNVLRRDMDNRGSILRRTTSRSSCQQSQSASSAHQDDVTSTKSSVHTQSNNRRIQIELQRLEEEKLAHKEYIDQKYRILLQDCKSNEPTDRRSFTEEWINNVSDQRNNDFEEGSEGAFGFNANRSRCPSTTERKREAGFGKEFDDLPHITENPIKVSLTRNSDNGISAPIGQDQLRVLDKNQIAARHVVTRDLPNFDGNPEDWPLFYSRFRNSTELCGYSNAENLDRLQKCLKGKALEAVRHRLLSPASLSQVIDTLRMLFGRPEFIVNHLIVKVSQLPPPKMDKLDTIVDFAMSVQNVSATIEAAELHQHLSNPTLISGLVNKLPVHIRLDWARFKVLQSIVTLSTLANWLYNLAEVVATVIEPEFTTSDDKKANKYGKKSSESQKKKPEYFNAHQEGSKADVQQRPKEGNESFSTSRQNQHKSCIICQKNCPSVAECAVFKSFEINQRWKMVSSKKLCRTCLRMHFGFCRQNKSCGVNNCIIKHHQLLHDEQRVVKNAESKQVSSPPEISNVHIKINANVLLRIIPIKLFGVGCSINTFAFVDEGSTTSLIDRRIADKLNIQGTPKELCLLWSGTVHRIEKNSREISVGISSTIDKSIQYVLRGVKTVDNLGIPAQRINKEELCRKFPYLRDVPFDDYERGSPGILIGSNNPKIGIPIEIIEGKDAEPIASRTRIGWTVHGPTCNLDSTESMNPKRPSNPHFVEECPCDHDHDNDLHQYVKEYFSVENFGVQINNFMNKDSKDNERAMDQMKKLTRKVDNGYECGLLWKHDMFELPDSYRMAYKRLQCLENRHPEMISVINDKIVDYIEKGYATKLTKEEVLRNNQRVWYLPIFAVINPKKPGKIRPVFDAAAKVNGVSLNSMLLKGPDQLISLIDILRRFREKSIAAVGDITEMYHRIKTRAEDKHCQRFLWRNGENREPDVYTMNVMTFGATCSPSIAHYIKNYNASKFDKEFPQAAETITQNHYVDDMMETEHTEEGMIKLINEVKMIHAEGGFHIRNFLSNSKAVMQAVGSKVDSNQQIKSIVPEKDINIERVLGMYWNIDTDCFTFSLKYSMVNKEIMAGTKLPTKRELLQLLMSIFDPLGLISHYLIHLKIIIQEIWRSNLTWDQQITDQKVIKLWLRWLDLLPSVEDIQVPRLYTPKLSPNTSTFVELHMFMDASEDAFGAVCYLRVGNEDGIDCSLVGSKSRVAPIKYLSIPRKELQAALLGTRLFSSILSGQTFQINRKIFWSDSKTVLSWLRSDHRKYHQFVAHRVGEILESTEQNEWRWVPSKLNVADEMTKWAKTPSFEMSNRWFRGPDFLRQSEDYWPESQIEIEETEEEMKLNFSHSEISAVCLVNTERFSNWNRMTRALAYVIRYVRILKARVRKEPLIQKHLSQEELLRAKQIIIRQAQVEEYPEEIVTLILNKGRLPDQQICIPKSSSIYQCSPYLDEEGILRIRGRIDLAENIHHDTKRPIILPMHNKITKLLMKSYHRIYHHRNNETVVNEIRQKYYIPKLRVVLKTVIKNECQACKNRKAKPEAPEMAHLPFGRLAVGFRPFTHTGVDFFGPLEVVVGRRVEKRWVSIFTCMTIRAVHMEIAYSISTESFIKCLRNFINIRGRPDEMYSDQGTNFVGADKELARVIDNIDLERVATEFTTSYSKWNFNPPHAPNFGGAWERLVRSVKISLYEVLPTRRPDDETLRSLLMEIQNVINSRPLTFISLDIDNDEALTPNHFIHGSSNGIKPPGVFESDGPILRSAWQENQRITDLFWKRFVREYLPTLTRRTKWYRPVKPLEIGDVGIDFDNNYARNCYPKVRIIDRTMDYTGQVRRVKCQFANKSMLWRPASKVARLDVLSKEDAFPTCSTATRQEVLSENGLTVAQCSSKTEGNVEKATRSSARIANKKEIGTSRR